MKARFLKSQVEGMIEALQMDKKSGATVAWNGLTLEIKTACVRTWQEELESLGLATALIEEGDFGGHGILAVNDFKAKLPSTKKLVKIMSLIGHAMKTNDKGEALGISSETYGSKTCAYLSLSSMAERAEVERKLTALGIKVNENYHPGHPVVDVQVSYKKAFGWNA